MRIGVFLGNTGDREASLDSLLESARDAEARGFATAWMPHIPWSFDAVTTLALAAQITERIELGTAVVPTYPRHPLSLAQDAMTVQVASGGRFTLGIGPSHQGMIEQMYGLAFDKPAAHTAEYVQALQACFAGPDVTFEGEHFTMHALLQLPGATPPPVLVAALAPKMLELTGRLADGTITNWADERTIAEHVVPRITSAAEAAGRPAPRVVMCLPVAVVDDVDAIRDEAAAHFVGYTAVPSYKAMLERGESSNPVDIALIGTEATLRARLQRFADAGGTDLLANVVPLTGSSRERTLDFLASY